MIPYHGLPITPATVGVRVIVGGSVFVCHRNPGQLLLVLEFAKSMAFDNGAFPAWTNGTPILDWEPYYDWVGEYYRCPQFDFAVIPDVIDGDEDQNDALLAEWPWLTRAPHVGAPVWHMHESLARLLRLATEFPRVCIGSSAQFSVVGSPWWWARMVNAMNTVCDKQGRPITKLHGLRMLNPKIFTQLPLASADSTNIARNHGIDSAWKGTYSPPHREARADVMRARIESQQSLTYWDRKLNAERLEKYFSRLNGDDLVRFAEALSMT